MKLLHKVFQRKILRNPDLHALHNPHQLFRHLFLNVRSQFQKEFVCEGTGAEYLFRHNRTLNLSNRPDQMIQISNRDRQTVGESEIRHDLSQRASAQTERQLPASARRSRLQTRILPPVHQINGTRIDHQGSIPLPELHVAFQRNLKRNQTVTDVFIPVPA